MKDSCGCEELAGSGFGMCGACSQYVGGLGSRQAAPAAERNDAPSACSTLAVCAR